MAQREMYNYVPPEGDDEFVSPLSWTRPISRPSEFWVAAIALAAVIQFVALIILIASLSTLFPAEGDIAFSDQAPTAGWFWLAVASLVWTLSGYVAARTARIDLGWLVLVPSFGVAAVVVLHAALG